MTAFFYSPYIIDGVAMDSTPAQLLGDTSCVAVGSAVIDDSVDPSPGGYPFDESKVESYLSIIRGRTFPLELAYSGPSARCELAYALIDSLWAEGHFVLEDLKLSVNMRWSIGALGEAASLYKAAEEISNLCSEFDLPVVGSNFGIGTKLLDFRVENVSSERIVPSKLKADKESWIIYIPFDTDSFHLGGSELTSAMEVKGGVAPNMEDPDYFMDCFEVVREMSEDGILLSASTVGRGGIIKSMDRMCSETIGADIDISQIRRAYPSSDAVRILFSEVPGVLIQIADSDFDYVDAELLLQDVMYFPLGHAVYRGGGVRVSWSDKSAIGAILDSLIR